MRVATLQLYTDENLKCIVGTGVLDGPTNHHNKIIIGYSRDTACRVRFPTSPSLRATSPFRRGKLTKPESAL